MGTVKWEKEEQIIVHWRDYLADCEGMFRQVYETGPHLLHILELEPQLEKKFGVGHISLKKFQ